MYIFESYSGYRIPQRFDELGDLIALMKLHGVESYLEIGSRFGDSFRHIVQSLPSGSKAVSIDLPGNVWGRDDSKQYLEENVMALQKQGYDATVLFADSTEKSTVEWAELKGPFDAVMIDGDHRFEGLFLDWMNYGKLANKMVILHDIDGYGHFEGRTKDPIDVPAIWNILKRRYPYKELVSFDRGMGIGVLFVGENK